MKHYYAERAPVYDRVYTYPERQADISELKKLIPEYFIDRAVLEVAAGTGYWTEQVSKTSVRITATDANPETLALFNDRNFGCKVNAVVGDAYELQDFTVTYDAGFAALWFSHIPVERREEWLHQFHACLQPGALVMLMDNTEAQTERLPIHRQDELGNTYQNRTTDSGREYEVLKNFPAANELQMLLPTKSQSIQFLEHFWIATYSL